MLISIRKLLQQKTDSVRVRILDLNAPDSAGFQWLPLERKKDPKVLISIAYRIQWNSVAQYLERETRLELGPPYTDLHRDKRSNFFVGVNVGVFSIHEKAQSFQIGLSH
jgi:hypothetical protein